METPKSKRLITSLKENEVFVFGTNRNGFHGAGSAGYAFRGDSKNTWRQDKQFLQALKNIQAHPKGKWAQLGISKGPMEGTEGKSYGIVTVSKPGARRSISPKEIISQLKELGDYAQDHPELTFLVVLGPGYNGYSKQEWHQFFEEAKLPENCERV